MSDAVTLAEHLHAAGGPAAAPVGAIVGRLAVVGTRIARELAQAPLVGRLGSTGETNVQGETVKKLDRWANDVVAAALEESGLVCTLVSEEMDEPLHLERRCGRGRYVVCFDPVDGSSNLDVNGVVGTIFSIREGHGYGPASEHWRADACQAGTAQVAAGYIMYGPATMLVLTTGDGVDAFTQDPATGEFVRTQTRVRIPSRGRIYSVNEGNFARWEPGVQRYVEHLRAPAAAGGSYTARYVGSLVADFHRTLLEGGIYLYPADAGAGRASGKLRLQYEAAPMGFIAEQAGGRASTGRERIMAIAPGAPHQRVPLLIGSPEDVGLAEDFIAGRQ